MPHIQSIANLPSVNLSSIALITNAAHYPLYASWAKSLNTHSIGRIPPITVLSDSTISYSTRLGAIHDLQIALPHISRVASTSTENSPPPPPTFAIVITADTLIPGTDFANDVVQKFGNGSTECSVGMIAYKLSDMSDCVRRGMLSVKQHSKTEQLIAAQLVEKPSSIELAPSPWATAPIYFLRSSTWLLITTFLSERATQPTNSRDAPGHLLS